MCCYRRIFGAAVLSYSILAVLQSAVWSAHELHISDIKLSSYFFASEIRTHYAGMMMAIAPAAWERYDKLTPAQLAQTLLHMPTQELCESIPEAPGAKPGKALCLVPSSGAMLQEPACSTMEWLSNTFKASPVNM
jgi:hypothetical protein